MQTSPTPEEELQIRFHGDPANPTLIFLPGLHGDWTLIASFRKIISRNFYFIELTYPRTLQWSLNDYAHAVESILSASGIKRGWILAESFSSQVLWEMPSLKTPSSAEKFICDGLIMAGGFVRYPFMPMVRIVRWLLRIIPWNLWKILLRLYRFYSTFRHRNAPESAAAVSEFVSRRTPLDISAMVHRLTLVLGSDPRPAALAARFPIYLLAGIIDPVVPTWPVLRWLRRNSPTFAGSRIIWPADHNVLGTEPAQSAQQIELWINGST